MYPLVQIRSSAGAVGGRSPYRSTDGAVDVSEQAAMSTRGAGEQQQLLHRNPPGWARPSADDSLAQIRARPAVSDAVRARAARRVARDRALQSMYCLGGKPR